MSLHDIIAQPPAGAPAAAPAAEPTAENANPVKRSWRRKYRKMRRVFEDRMEMSNSLIKHEYRAKALARRLQEENEYGIPGLDVLGKLFCQLLTL